MPPLPTSWPSDVVTRRFTLSVVSTPTVIQEPRGASTTNVCLSHPVLGSLQPSGAAPSSVPCQYAVRCRADTVSAEAALTGATAETASPAAHRLSSHRPPDMLKTIRHARLRHLLVSAPGQEHGRVGQQRGHVGQELRTGLTIDDAMVERQRQLRHLAYGDLASVHPRHVTHGAEAEDRCLTGVDDRCAVVHAEHTNVGDGDAAALHVGRR